MFPKLYTILGLYVPGAMFPEHYVPEDLCFRSVSACGALRSKQIYVRGAFSSRSSMFSELNVPKALCF